MTYNFNAVWLLQSICNAEQGKNDGADLRDVISVADYVNRAIMTYDEFCSGLELLLKLKLVEQNGVVLRTSDDFKQWYKEKFEGVKKSFPQKERQEMEKYVQALAQNTTGDPDVSIQITEVDLGMAIKRYRATF